MIPTIVPTVAEAQYKEIILFCAKKHLGRSKLWDTSLPSTFWDENLKKFKVAQE